jgi:hypothetical protein
MTGKDHTVDNPAHTVPLGATRSVRAAGSLAAAQRQRACSQRFSASDAAVDGDGLALALVAGVSNERFNPTNTARRGDDLRQTLPGARAMNSTNATLLVAASDRDRSGATRAWKVRQVGWWEQD